MEELSSGLRSQFVQLIQVVKWLGMKLLIKMIWDLPKVSLQLISHFNWYHCNLSALKIEDLHAP